MFGCTFLGTTHAADQGTAAEAEAIVKQAVFFRNFKENDKAVDEITNGKTFKHRDL